MEEFTRVERVQGVECRSCTLQHKRVELEEDVTMYRGALESAVARKATDENTKHLRLSLEKAQARLDKVLSVGVDDDDDADLDVLADEEDGLSDELEAKLEIERHDSYKCLLLTRLPAILAIHVQRRFFDPVRNCMSKTAQHVIFPEYLDVAPFCATGGPPDDRVKEEHMRSVSRKPSIHYRLTAVIEHQGDAFFGHYVSYRRDLSSDGWLFVSDNTVRPVGWNVVRQCQAYMLFYEAS